MNATTRVLNSWSRNKNPVPTGEDILFEERGACRHLQDDPPSVLRTDTHALADAAGLVARVGLHDTVRLERVGLQH